MKIRTPTPPEPGDLVGYPADLLREIYRRMFLIRNFELRVNEMFLKGMMPGTIHLSHGQEATVVGACLALRSDDQITLTHRGHGQALAKGVTAKSLMAELFGKETGCCGGMGGSLHVGDMSVGALPAIAIVGASSPIAVGLAFGAARLGMDIVVGNFIGDGTANKGDWHEAMNLAAIWDLPVVFICENNFWAVSTHISEMMRVDHVADRAASYGMPGVTVYGNDPIPVYEAVGEAAERARSGGGPSLVECLTYRRGGHKRDDPASYRPQEEVDAWLGQDPVSLFRDRLLGDTRLGDTEVDRVENEVLVSLLEAVRFAQESPEPPTTRALEGAYA